MKSKILFVLCLLTGLMFINAGLNKFFQYIPMPEDLPDQVITMFNAMMQITWLMPLLATFEIIGGILFAIPRFRALGALMLTPIMVGLLLHHIVIGTGYPIPIVLTIILVWAIIEDKVKFMPLINK